MITSRTSNRPTSDSNSSMLQLAHDLPPPHVLAPNVAPAGQPSDHWKRLGGLFVRARVIVSGESVYELDTAELLRKPGVSPMDCQPSGC